jgi:hypothetical protein
VRDSSPQCLLGMSADVIAYFRVYALLSAHVRSTTCTFPTIIQ